jgi:hypothetical protein
MRRNESNPQEIWKLYLPLKAYRMTQGEIMEKTTAMAILIEAIRAYKDAHNIPAWEDDLIQIAEPGDEDWIAWQHDGTHIEGDPAHAEVALCIEGYGTYYGCVEAAVADLWKYFADDFTNEE